MEAILKIPYYYSDPACDFDSDREMTLQEYTKKMVDTYMKYNPIIQRNIHRLYNNLSNNNEEKERNTYRQMKMYYSDTKSFVNDMDNQPLNIDTLIEYYQSGEMFIVDLQLPLYDKDDDLEPEIKAWIRETIKINCSNLSPEEKLQAYSERDLRLEFPNSKSTAILRKSKMIDIVNNHTFAFLVDEIIFLSNE